MSTDPSVKLIPLTCARCDAPLRVGERDRSVICEHCGTQLLVERQGDVVRTEIVEEYLRRTRELVNEVRALRAERRLKTLDRRWQRRRLRAQQPPQPPTGPQALAVLTLFAITMLIMLGAWPVALILIAILVPVSLNRARKLSERARRVFRKRRRMLVAALQKEVETSGAGWPTSADQMRSGTA